MCRTANRVLFILFALLILLTAPEIHAWQPAAGPLTTRWTHEVSATNAWPEYPRPQMVREKWTNLNGLWQYAVRPAAEGQPTKWDGEILVPFAIESVLSGVKKAVQPDERLWYHRTFSAPQLEKGGRLLLHFGAVDWQCRVWVNGREVGQHTGGYDPFTFDITDHLNNSGSENEIVVAVTDPTDTGSQPRGKQVLKPQGIFYTAVTGIWQTVWLEPVPERHIRSLRITPRLNPGGSGTVTVDVRASLPGTARARVLCGNKEVMSSISTVKVLDSTNNGKLPRTLENELHHAQHLFTYTMPDPQVWSPDDPFLYELEIDLLDDHDNVVDKVDSYFGMRTIEVKKDAEGLNRLWLNNQVVFQYGPLDQGWWPDGLYTAPTDAALKYDIEMTKRLGMNMARKHVKVEPERWYYWCDRLGLLVWQDMPSGDAHKDASSKANYRRELKAMIEARRNHPSIVMWVPFNEGWGQHDTPEVAAWVKELDPTRLVNEASGWDDKGSGDVSDMHKYPGPGMRDPEPRRAGVLGEFGGLGMPVSGHTWQAEKNWGYVSFTNADELTNAYVDLLTMLRPLIQKGLSAAVYTQTTDCEIEVNGLMTYDRARVKMNEPRIVEAAKKLFLPPPKMKVLAATSEATPQPWRYTFERPATGWEQPGFDAAAWESGSGGFGAKGTPGAKLHTEWNTPDIWLRRTFKIEDLNAAGSGELILVAHHDEDAEVYVNGALVRALKGFTQQYAPTVLSDAARKLLRQGGNTIAVHCHQTGGGQYIDVGLSEMIEP